MASNLCRCTGYQNILRAVRLAADAVADPCDGALTRTGRTLRVEDPRLLAGRGRFVDDVDLPDQLWLRVVRSQVAHAILREVDTERGARVAKACIRS